MQDTEPETARDDVPESMPESVAESGPETVQRPAGAQAPRLEHSALPWYQHPEPAPEAEPGDHFPPVEPFRSSRFWEPSLLDEDEPHRGRIPLIVFGVVSLAAVVAAVVVGVVVLLRPHAAPVAATTPTPRVIVSSGSTADGAAPTNLKLGDAGGSVTLTWTDPSGGSVPFFVEVGKPGAQLQLYNTLSPGETTYRVVGLNPRLDYCFSVIAVYGTNVVAPSNLVCTQRGTNSAPSPTR
jgi:hypothetical protein